MAPRRKAIKLLPHERKLAVKLYLKYNLPIEQLEARPVELAEFTTEWHEISGQKHTAQELLHYMRNERKCGRWVKLGSKCPPVPTLPDMTSEETDALVMIYEENVAVLGLGSDAIAYDPE